MQSIEQKLGFFVSSTSRIVVLSLMRELICPSREVKQRDKQTKHTISEGQLGKDELSTEDFLAFVPSSQC